MKIPCKDCLIIPICRHKYFLDLRKECSVINSYLYDEDMNKLKVFHERIDGLYKILKPLYWQLGVSEYNHPYLKYKRRKKKSITTLTLKRSY